MMIVDSGLLFWATLYILCGHSSRALRPSIWARRKLFYASARTHIITSLAFRLCRNTCLFENPWPSVMF